MRGYPTKPHRRMPRYADAHVPPLGHEARTLPVRQWRPLYPGSKREYSPALGRYRRLTDGEPAPALETVPRNVRRVICDRDGVRWSRAGYFAPPAVRDRRNAA